MRTSGILAAVTSLPGEYGIGTLGDGAFSFVDFLSSCGQTYWQILPVNPPGSGNSPYQAHSAFAGNPFLIDPLRLQKDGLLLESEREKLLLPNTGRVDYSLFNEERLSVLKKAAERVDEKSESFLRFESENEFWLSDYCIYMALKEKNKMKPLCNRADRNILPNGEMVLIHKKLQYLFFNQWKKLKDYANKNGIKIIGDIPIYVSHDSADFFAHRNLFLTDEWGNPSRLAGCPPDSFSKTGQLWGNPIYDWDKMEDSGYWWWKQRFFIAQKLFDVVRIDHFRGFYEYYSVSAGSKNAINGEWRKGPGMKLVEIIRSCFPSLGIIAEDLGFLTKEAREFFRESGFPGMKVLQFAFDEKNSEYLPHNFEKNCVVYTGTHDNPTVLEWICTAEKKKLSFAMDYLRADSIKRLCDSFIESALASCADTAIIPVQDWLKKGKAARMNTPSTVKNNWEFRIQENELTNRLSEKILYYTLLFSRQEETK